MPLSYEVQEHKKDAHKYIVINGYEGKVSDLVIPKEIDGYPVEAIGNHAFSGRQDIECVKLPESIKTLYGFAFHNCRNLKKIILHDSVDDYYDGVCRQCDNLTDIEMFMDRGWYEVVRNFLADNDKTLRFWLHVRTSADESTSCLSFPEYVYDFNENTMARTIQFSIAGSGMFYRECVDRRTMDYRQYDRLFDKAIIDGGEVAEDIAVGRLLYPVELSDEARKKYEDFVEANAEKILLRLVDTSEKKTENKDMIKRLVSYSKDLVSSSIDMAIRFATSKGLTEVAAIIMDYGAKKAEGTMEIFEL